LILRFNNCEQSAETNSYGAFYLKNISGINDSVLQQVILSDGEPVKIIEGLYDLNVHKITSDTIVVSDIDDTLVHSFINKKLHKFRTLMFTTMEKRKAVVNMQDLIKNFTTSGAAPIYLSNSEQNLYPIIYRFLQHNSFPHGPIFLKQLRSLWQVIRNIKLPVRNTHKITTIDDLIAHFPQKKFVLMGDNTQHDLEIYLSVAEKYPKNISQIIIRKVAENPNDKPLILAAAEKLKVNDISFFYSDNFDSLQLDKSP
jgi:phosphatidate phosphatase APP1